MMKQIAIHYPIHVGFETESMRDVVEQCVGAVAPQVSEVHLRTVHGFGSRLRQAPVHGDPREAARHYRAPERHVG